MSKKFKSQASSGRLPTAGFGGFGGSAFGSSRSSTLSYVQEAPDYSGISDANIVVAFKNLSKRDATTKAKALEDLTSNVSSPDASIEEGLLEAWVRYSHPIHTRLRTNCLCIGQTVPSSFHRFRSTCSPIVAHPQRPNMLKSWKENGKAHAHNRRPLVGGNL